MTPGVSRPVPCMTEPVSKLFAIGAILLLGYCFMGTYFVGTFSSRDFFLGTPGVSRPVPCMTESVSKLFVASVNFVLWHWDCFVKNLLMGQMKV